LFYDLQYKMNFVRVKELKQHHITPRKEHIFKTYRCSLAQMQGYQP